MSEIEAFLVEDAPFRNLSTNLCLSLLPASFKSLTRVLMSLPRHCIWFSEDEDRSISNRIKIFIEGVTEENWNWWPLRPKMKVLQKEQTRVQWICVSKSPSQLRHELTFNSIAIHTYGPSYPNQMLKFTKHF
jgi:hypothetical protein